MKKRRGRPSNISKAAALLGSRGGKIGGLARAAALPAEQREQIAAKAGRARAASLTPTERSAIAKLAAIARWSAREVHA